MRNEIIAFISTVVAIIIFLSLKYFYKNKVENKMLQGKQRLVGIAILVISVIVAVMLMR